MVNTLDTYWSIGGVSLNTLAAGIEDLTGLEVVPDSRGNNTVVPFRFGEYDEDRVVGGRTITLGMWVRGTDDDGVYHGPASQWTSQFQYNLRTLMDLLYNEGESYELTKRFMVPSGDSGGEPWEVKSATASVKFVGGLQPTFDSYRNAHFTCDLRIAKAYFYDDEDTSVNLEVGTNIVDVDSEVRTEKVSIYLNGLSSGWNFENTSLGLQAGFSGGISAPDYVILDAMNWSAIEYTPDPTVTNRVSKFITHAGSSSLFRLKKGSNTIVTSRAAGTGPATLHYRGAWR